MNNSTNFSGIEGLLPKSTAFAVCYIVYLVECGTIAVATALLLLATFVNRRLQTKGGLLIAYLQLLEFLIFAILSPASTLPSQRFANTLSKDYCSVIALILMTLQHSGLWTMVSLAINRFIAIVIPQRYATLNTKCHIISAVSASLAIGLALNLPVYFGYGSKFGLTRGGKGFCGKILSPSQQTANWFICVNAIVGMQLPLVITGLAYLVIFAHIQIIRRRGRRSGIPTNNVLSRMQNHRAALARILLLSYGWYMVCLIALIVAYDFFGSPQDWFEMLVVILYGTAYIGNPFSVLLLSPDHRAAIKQLLRRIVDTCFRANSDGTGLGVALVHTTINTIRPSSNQQDPTDVHCTSAPQPMSRTEIPPEPYAVQGASKQSQP